MLKIDFVAVDKFWELTTSLKTDKPLSEKLWENFYDVTGNKRYAENNIGKEGIAAFKESLEIVFRPSFQKELYKRISEKDEWVIKINRYKRYESEFKAFQKTLQQADYVTKMYEHAYSQLPPSMQQIEKDAEIYFTAIGADAAALDKTIFLSLHLSFFFDRYKKGAIGGHELHHLLRKEFVFNKPVLDMHKGLVYLLEGILNEGVADLIDKTIVMEYNDDLPSELQWKSILVNEAAQVISEIDETISLSHEWDKNNFKTEKDFRKLIRNTSGHVPGFFMANVIRKNGYHHQLMENISDPFHFIRLYNKAAKEDMEQPALFSEKCIENIQKIEMYYKN